MVRYKNRYFAAEIDVRDRPSHAPFQVSKAALQVIILNKIHELHGDFGLASVKTGFRVKYCNPYTKIVLIRSRHGPHRFVATVLPLIKSIDNVNVHFNILYVGATMIKSFRVIRNHQLATLEKYWNKMKSDNDRVQLKEALLTISGSFGKG